MEPPAARSKNRSGNGRRQGDDWRLTGPDRRSVRRFNAHDVNWRHVNHPGHAVLREPSVRDPPLRELYTLEQRAANALHERALDLIPKTIRVHNGAAVERTHDPPQNDAAVFQRH